MDTARLLTVIRQGLVLSRENTGIELWLFVIRSTRAATPFLFSDTCERLLTFISHARTHRESARCREPPPSLASVLTHTVPHVNNYFTSKHTLTKTHSISKYAETEWPYPLNLISPAPTTSLCAPVEACMFPIHYNIVPVFRHHSDGSLLSVSNTALVEALHIVSMVSGISNFPHLILCYLFSFLSHMSRDP